MHFFSDSKIFWGSCRIWVLYQKPDLHFPDSRNGWGHNLRPIFYCAATKSGSAKENWLEVARKRHRQRPIIVFMSLAEVKRLQNSSSLQTTFLDFFGVAQGGVSQTVFVVAKWAASRDLLKIIWSWPLFTFPFAGSLNPNDSPDVLHHAGHLFYHSGYSRWSIFWKPSVNATARLKTQRAPHMVEGSWEVPQIDYSAQCLVCMLA